MSTGRNGTRFGRQLRTSRTDARDDQIATMYRSGKTLKATGAAFGLTRERVRQILKKLGIPSRRGVPFSRASGDAVARLYERGKTIDEAAAAVGVSAFVARNMLIERGIERRTGASGVYLPGSTRKRQASMARLYEQGKTFREISDAHQTSTTSVQRALDRLGIARRGRGTRVKRP